MCLKQQLIRALSVFITISITLLQACSVLTQASPQPEAARLQTPVASVVATLAPTPSPTPLPPTPTPDPRVGATRQAIDAYMTRLTNQGFFSGAVMVVRDGKLLLSKGYGMANEAQHIPNTPQTPFRLASVTKQFTAVAILILQNQGKLNIHDPICTYLPECPLAWQDITIRHLLNHTSGIPDYTMFDSFEHTEMMTTSPNELIARFINEPLVFLPGQGYAYSNSGYVLLGVIIEEASGQTYENFIQTHIFEPLNMTSSGYDHSTGMLQDVATGYITGTQEASFLNVSTLYSAGALYSTVEDLYRWDQSFYTEKLLPRALIEEMYTPTDTGEGYGSGYGWKIKHIDGHLVAFHTGTFSGARNYIARFPNERMTIIILCNRESFEHQAMGDALAHVIFETWGG